MSVSDDAVAPAALLADLRERVFRLGARPAPRRIGAEIELIAVAAETGGIVPLEADGDPSLLAFLRRYGAALGWVEERAPEAAPRFHLPGGGMIGFEPGGQLEFSSPPFATATALIAALDAVVPPLCAAAAGEGIEFLGVGVDPRHPVEQAVLQVRGERYLRMADYFARIGPAGAIMMRQSASIQVNLDFEDEPLLRWRVLNAAAPYLIAIFANSPVHAGQPTGHRSFRSHAWRTLDPARTGIFRGEGDAVTEYLDFALDAPAVLMGPVAGEVGRAGEYAPFRDWIDRGAATREEWIRHLTTLFPEVSPRGYVEVRSVDALAPEWYAAPIALLAGMVYHRPSLLEAADLLGAPDPALLERAGRAGLSDSGIADVARDLFEIALRGCRALGPEFIDRSSIETAREFFERYTRYARSPADDALPLTRLGAGSAARAALTRLSPRPITCRRIDGVSP